MLALALFCRFHDIDNHMHFRKIVSLNLLSVLAVSLVLLSCAYRTGDQKPAAAVFNLKHDHDEGTISLFAADGTAPVLVQHAKSGVRPYIHPIVAPDGRGVLTEFSPAHHKHQTGLYWGLKRVNERDYFMNWKEDYWRRISSEILVAKGAQVKWRTQYDLLDEGGRGILTETQTWSFRESDGKFILDLEWRGTAKTSVTMGKFYVGGLFLRMPWHEGVRGAAINSAGQRNGAAEGERAIWNDIGIQVAGREDLAHLAILDHPDNHGFPTAWRVDNELGVGPSRQILGDWTIPAGETEVIRYRLIAYTGDFRPEELNIAWKVFVCAGPEG